MRNALVVLVPLCVGLTSGFIVPSGLREVLGELSGNFYSIDDSGSKSRDLNAKKDQMNSTETNTTIFLERPANDSLEADLYEGSDTKDLEVKERSFIYIKQRGLKPNRLYSSNILKQQADENHFHKSYLSGVNRVIDEFPRRFSTEYADKIQNTYLEHSKKPGPHNNHMKYDPNATLHLKPLNVILNEQKDYIALLEAPLLRPDDRSMEAKKLENNLLKTKIKNTVRLLYPGEYSNILSEDEESERKDIFLFDSTIRTFNKLNVDNVSKSNIKAEKADKPNINFERYQYCKDCLKKSSKYTFNNRLLIESLCKCSTETFLKDKFIV